MAPGRCLPVRIVAGRAGLAVEAVVLGTEQGLVAVRRSRGREAWGSWVRRH